jgi:hypothetical protein
VGKSTPKSPPTRRAMDVIEALADSIEGRSRSPPDEMRLKAYGFIGAALEIGIAWLDGQLPLTMDEVIDQLVEVFYRISGITP